MANQAAPILFGAVAFKLPTEWVCKWQINKTFVLERFAAARPW